jgi:hypothetical protein
MLAATANGETMAQGARTTIPTTMILTIDSLMELPSGGDTTNLFLHLFDGRW